jgi:hypothetical protein
MCVCVCVCACMYVCGCIFSSEASGVSYLSMVLVLHISMKSRLSFGDPPVFSLICLRVSDRYKVVACRWCVYVLPSTKHSV